jgi:diamine N-acetyltransferase
MLVDHGNAAPILVHRPTTRADLEFVCATEKAAENSPFVLGWPEQQHLQALDDRGIAHWILEAPGVDARSIGFVILAGVDLLGGTIEFKRLVVREKGVGFGREAVRLVKREVFGRLEAHRLWLDVFEDNERARTLYRSEGFREEGTLREHVRCNGEWRSLVIMSLLRREYDSGRNQ